MKNKLKVKEIKSKVKVIEVKSKDKVPIKERSNLERQVNIGSVLPDLDLSPTLKQNEIQQREETFTPLPVKEEENKEVKYTTGTLATRDPDKYISIEQQSQRIEPNKNNSLVDDRQISNDPESQASKYGFEEREKKSEKNKRKNPWE